MSGQLFIFVDFDYPEEYISRVQTELQLPNHDTNEIEEKAVHRSDLIRAKFGSLAKFLETFSSSEEEEPSFEMTRRASGKVKRSPSA